MELPLSLAPGFSRARQQFILTPAAPNRIHAEDRTTKYTKRKAVPRRHEVEDSSLAGDWEVKPVIQVCPPAWLQFDFVYFVLESDGFSAGLSARRGRERFAAS